MLKKKTLDPVHLGMTDIPTARLHNRDLVHDGLGLRRGILCALRLGVFRDGRLEGVLTHAEAVEKLRKGEVGMD